MTMSNISQFIKTKVKFEKFDIIAEFTVFEDFISFEQKINNIQIILQPERNNTCGVRSSA